MKQYIGISRDHSGSMRSLKVPAMQDYNGTISAIKEAAEVHKIDTIVSVVRCGIRSAVDREVVNSTVAALAPLIDYPIGDQTPLFDSVGTLIDILSSVPDADDPGVSFLIQAVTDGAENMSVKWKDPVKLSAKIAELQATDRWTFTFRVPKGYGGRLNKMGIPAGNIVEWDTTERGMAESSMATQAAFRGFYEGRSKGARSTTHFYASGASLRTAEVKASMENISHEVRLLQVHSDGYQVRPFVENRIGRPMRIGGAFYQLSKTERVVQSHKLILVRSKVNGTTYAGRAARDLLGLPHQGTISLSPGNYGEWEIFIQSTSTNRNLIAGTNLLYWENFHA